MVAYAAGTPEDPSTARRLSLSRALAVRSALMADGVTSARIYVRALGATGGDEAPDRVDLAVMGGNARVAGQCTAPDAGRQEPDAVTRPNVYPDPHGGLPGWRWSPSPALLSPVLLSAFANNPLLNSLILLVLLIGIGWNLRQVLRLSPEVDLAGDLPDGRARGSPPLPSPQLLAPMASMLAAREAQSRTDQARFTLSAAAMRSLLDGIASRLDESRELSRYMTGLLIFLGLLGTFWGLLQTIGAVSDVIGGMSVGSGDLNALFDQLKSGLAKPLEGHGHGVLRLDVRPRRRAGAGLPRPHRRPGAEPLLQRAGGMAGRPHPALLRRAGGGRGGSVPVYVQALLEQTAENMEDLQRILSRGEEGRAQANQAVLALTERIATLTDAMRTSQQLMLRIAEAQAALGPALQRLAEQRRDAGFDDAARGHLRNIELYLQRLLADAEQGRAQSDRRAAQRSAHPDPDGRRAGRGPAR